MNILFLLYTYKCLTIYMINGPGSDIKLKQGLHRLEKYLNLEDFLQKSLKITQKSWKVLEFIYFL